MADKVEIPNKRIQKLTLLVTMNDYDGEKYDAGEWLANVLLAVKYQNETSKIAAEQFLRMMQVVSVKDCEIVVCDGV